MRDNYLYLLTSYHLGTIPQKLKHVAEDNAGYLTYKSHIMTTQYDSKAEETFHLKHPELISLHSDYPAVFRDDVGFLFNARSDFYDRQSQTYIEFKSHQLNTKETHAIAMEKWIAQQPYLNSRNKTLKMCENQWCHSMIKQSIVQRTLAKQGIKMVVVFKDGTRITTVNKNRMKLLNLNWQYESDYFEVN